MTAILNQSLRSSRSSLIPFSLLLLTLGSGACTGKVVIGDAGSGGGMPSGGSEAVPGSGGGSSSSQSCEGADQEKRAQYDAWTHAEGNTAELDGATFEGYARGGPEFTLTFTEGGSGTLIVGEPIAPASEANEGYLCAWTDIDCRYATLKPGGTYAVHDAHYESHRLRFNFATEAALESWCQLQTPHDRGDCDYSPIENANVAFPGATTSPSPCLVNGADVDCDWFMPLFEDGVCECTSESCFPVMHLVPFDGTYDPDDATLEGSLGELAIVLTRTCAAGGAGQGGAGAGCGD